MQGYRHITLNFKSFRTTVGGLCRPDCKIEGHTEQERLAIAFIRDWVSDKSHFTINTSGSTGKPKPITLSRAQMIASANRTVEFFGLSSRDNCLVAINVAYIGGIMMLVRGLEAGMAIHIIEPVSNPLSQLENSTIIRFASFVPLQMKHMLISPQRKLNILNSMKGILIGGAPVSPELERSIRAIEAPTFQTYGMTETLSHVALRQLCPKLENQYNALDGVEFSLDKRGCLVISDPVVGLTKLVTNDLVELVSPRQFIWLGRIDNTVNSGGIKINLDEMEQRIGKLLLEMGIDHRFMLMGIADQHLGTKLVMSIEHNHHPIDLPLLHNRLKNQLPKYHSPHEIILLDKFIETASGKLDRLKMLQLIENRQ